MPTNKERAIRARTLLLDHIDGLECEVIDFLTDLRHMCREDDIDFAKCLRLAEVHFNAEVADDANPEIPPASILYDALLFVKHAAKRYHDRDTDNDTMVELIEDRIMEALKQAPAKGE